MADEDQHAERIFAEALDLEPEHRAAFLDQACRGASEVRSRVEELLLQDERAGSFLGRPLFISPVIDAVARFQPEQLIAKRFRIVRFLARGGMGEVYEASDLLLQQAHIAIKIIRPEIAADATTTSRFEQEVLLARTVVHPNLCPIYEIFRCEEPGPPFLFLTMRLLHGDTLDARLIASPSLPTSERLQICSQLLSGVAALHSVGVIHRDLKPRNVMLEQTAEHIKVSIMDFGLARLNQAESTLMGTGMVAGTPGYLAPELLRGERPTKATDLYALGIVLHQVLTGERPMESERGLSVTPSPLLRSVQAPASLIEAVESFLTTDPERRNRAFERVRRSQESAAPTSAFPDRHLLRTRPLWYRLAGACAVIALGLALWIWREHRQPAAGSLRSLAVLPLENISKDPNQEYLADGMTDELITRLGQIGKLRVISRATAMQYKNTHKPLAQVAHELNVDAVVEGSVSQSAGKVSIAARLVEASTGRQLWAQNYDGDMRDVLGLQSQVASAVAEQIRTKLTAKEQTQLADTQNVDPRAYEALLKGNYLFRQNTPDTSRKALVYFRQAVQLDPTFARAYVGIARCFNFLGEGDVAAGEATATSDAAVAKALQLQPELSEAYAERGWTLLFYHWDFPGAERDFRHSIELTPGSADAHEGYGTYLTAMGQFDDGLREMKTARDLDPLSPFLLANYCWMLHFARRYGEAEVQCLQSLELDSHFEWGKEHTAEIYFYQKNYSKANQYVATMDCDALCVAMVDEVYGVPGKRGAFDTWLKAQKHKPDAFFLAWAYSGLGRKDEAFAALEKAYELRTSPHEMTFVPVDPNFDSLRSDPRFDAFLRRVGLPPQPQGSFAQAGRNSGN